MAEPDQLRRAIAEARDELRAAIGEVQGYWETKPAGGEGEDAWSPRQVAEHVTGAEAYFGRGVALACDAEAPSRPVIDATTPAAAIASLERVAATTDELLGHVTRADLGKTYDMRRGDVSAAMTVEQMMEIMAGHARDHAQQIRAAGA